MYNVVFVLNYKIQNYEKYYNNNIYQSIIINIKNKKMV